MYFRTGEEKNMNLFCCKIAIIHCLLHSSKTMQLCETFLSNLPTYTHTHFYIYKRSQGLGGRKGWRIRTVWQIILSPQWDLINYFPLLIYHRESKHQMRHVILILSNIFVIILFLKVSCGARTLTAFHDQLVCCEIIL